LYEADGGGPKLASPWEVRDARLDLLRVRRKAGTSPADMGNDMHRPLPLSLSIIAALVALAGPLHAADWPTRPVTVIVPFGAGGNTDMMARLGAQHLTAKLGQTFVIENKPSAGGSLGTGQVATAAPDGYTLLFSASANINLTPQVQKLNFDPTKQLVPITNMGTGTQIMAIKRSLPVTTLREFIAYAKANPDKMTYGSAGNGSVNHLLGEMLKTDADIKLVHVPYKGAPAAIGDVMGGHIDVAGGWHHGPGVDRAARWDPAELGKVIPDLVAQAEPPTRPGAPPPNSPS